MFQGWDEEVGRFQDNQTVFFLTRGNLNVKPDPSDLLWRRANAQNVSFQSLYGGQFTLSPQLINPNFVFHVPTDAVPQFL